MTPLDPRPRTQRSTSRALAHLCVLACVVGAVAVAASGGAAVGATGNSSVGVNVLSAITIDDSACRAAGTRSFPAAPPGTGALTSACRIDFVSNNDSSMLRLTRRSRDAARPAMVRDEWTHAVQRAATGNRLEDIDAWSRTTAWAVGDGGEIVRTTDGGATWSPQTSGTVQNLNNVHVVDATTVWVVGDNGTVLLTTDAGATWTPRPTGSSANMNDVDATDAGNVWVTGDSGLIRRTDDAGATWVDVAAGGPTSNVYAVAVLDQRTAVVAARTSQAIWRTADRGATWTMVSSHPGTCDRFSLDAPTPSVVYAGRCSNTVGVSTDAGATWTIRSDAHSEGDDIVAVSPDEVFISDSNGAVDRSLDGLGSWPFHGSTSLGTYYGGWVTGLAVPAFDAVWWVGENGVIGRSTPGASVPDYGGGTNWGSGGSTSMFGVCVQALGGTTIPVWAADATGVSGTCEANDTDTWRAVPATATKIAEAAPGDTGRIDLVWGLRTSTTQGSGRYVAPVVFEAIAPGT